MKFTRIKTKRREKLQFAATLQVGRFKKLSAKRKLTAKETAIKSQAQAPTQNQKESPTQNQKTYDTPENYAEEKVQSLNAGGVKSVAAAYRITHGGRKKAKRQTPFEAYENSTQDPSSRTQDRPALALNSPALPSKDAKSIAKTNQSDRKKQPIAAEKPQFTRISGGNSAAFTRTKPANKSNALSKANAAAGEALLNPKQKAQTELSKLQRKITVKHKKFLAKTKQKAQSSMKKLSNAIVNATKSMVKSLLALLIGAAAPLLFVVIICTAVIVIVVSPFGIVGADQPAAGEIGLTQVCVLLDDELDEKITQITQNTAHDELIITYIGSDENVRINNWPDVLAIYSVATASNVQNSLPVATMNEETTARLSGIFWLMNDVTYRTQAVEMPTSPEYPNEKPQTKTVLYIDVTAKNYTEMYAQLAFSDEQILITQELLAMEEFQNIAVCAVGDSYIPGLTPEEIGQIAGSLPQNDFGGTLVKNALSHLGDPYQKRDCSAFTRYIYSISGINIPRTAAEQGKYCLNNGFAVNENDLQPGDLIFFAHKKKGAWIQPARFLHISHVGIYAGKGMIVDSSSSNSKVVYRKLYSGAVLYARPGKIN